MKKYISFILSIICILSLVGCNTNSMNYIIENKPSVTGIVEEVHDNHIIVYSETADGYPNGSNWSISLNVENKDSYTEVAVGDEIVFYYDGMAMETDPLQVSTVYAITLKTPTDRNKEERMLSSYFPPEFVIIDENWGVTLTAENITPTGAIIKCTQSSGETTGELQTGSWYIVENWTQEDGWKEMPYVIDDEIGWTAEAWMIPAEDTVEWEVRWEWLYGELPTGKYRIGKEIMDFRASGDYDKAVYFVEFEIE